MHIEGFDRRILKFNHMNKNKRGLTLKNQAREKKSRILRIKFKDNDSYGYLTDFWYDPCVCHS